MAKKNLESGRGINGKPRPVRCPGSKYFKTISPTPSKNEGLIGSPPRLSPVRMSSPQSACLASSPRTSPGLLAGHYAGCKFTEPPLPSALPPPPQHWMQSPHATVRPFTAEKPVQPLDISHRLKVVLKVQA